jgi:ribosome-associated protein
MLEISDKIRIPESEIETTAVRSQGPGGQNVNKVASAIHLRFHIPASSLPEEVRERLMNSHDYRITRNGTVVIKAQRYRTREQNLDDARARLKALILSALEVKKPRRKTRPTASSRQERLERKTRRGKIKKLRTKLTHYE